MPKKYVRKRAKVGPLSCPKCGHTWVTSSTLYYTTCPSCNYKVRNPYWRGRAAVSEQAPH